MRGYGRPALLTIIDKQKSTNATTFRVMVREQPIRTV
jgi:hypothetical protein